MVSTQTATLALDYVKTIGVTTNNMGRGFINPYDVALSKDGRIFVLNHCDSARRALIRVGMMNGDEDYLGEFGNGAGSGDGQFILPVAIAFDSQERLYITDEQNHRITLFDLAGNFLSKWGVLGSGDGELNGPSGITIDADDNLYVVDQNNNRVQKFTARGSTSCNGARRAVARVNSTSPGGGSGLARQRLRGRLAQRPHPEVHPRRPVPG